MSAMMVIGILVVALEFFAICFSCFIKDIRSQKKH